MPPILPLVRQALGSPPRPSSRSSPDRRGLTLVELIVVLGVLGLLAAFAMPALPVRQARAATFAEAIDAARRSAIVRAQTLELDVLPGGAWSLHPLAPDDSIGILRGQLDGQSLQRMVLRFTALGGCIPQTPMPDEYRLVDAAGCRVARRGDAS
jgi:prepilin-type N-terminal cleavage/methylation domain-containing protein